MEKITLFTTFRSADPAYSLNRVVQDQIKMLTNHGYKPTVIVAKGFEPVEEYLKCDIVEIPDVPVSNEVYIDKTFDADIAALKEALRPILKDSAVMITHDLIYQPAALKHNLAVRQLVAEDPEIKTKFLHWIHSATEPQIVQQIRGGGNKYLETLKIPFPRSLYIAFNTFSVPRIASWFGVEESLVKYVPHPHDFYEFFHEDAIKIAEKGNLLQKDVVMIYPCRLDRGKQAEYIIKIAAAVKETGRSVGAVIVDFHSTGGDKVTYRDEMKALALDLGLSETELIFASEIDKWNNPDAGNRASFPHQVTHDLFSISNTFILPSRTETYSLVAQEAAAARNFCILNYDFPPFRSIYGDAAHYAKFSSNIDVMTGMDGETNTKYTDEAAYWYSLACYINYVQENTRVLALANKIRKERNLNHVFKQNIEPLFFTHGKFNY